eukprot:487779-Pelagomonas_calceolata.AAC.1
MGRSTHASHACQAGFESFLINIVQGRQVISLGVKTDDLDNIFLDIDCQEFPTGIGLETVKHGLKII